jgi:hypothetical protein
MDLPAASRAPRDENGLIILTPGCLVVVLFVAAAVLVIALIAVTLRAVWPAVLLAVIAVAWITRRARRRRPPRITPM